MEFLYQGIARRRFELRIANIYRPIAILSLVFDILSTSYI